jgi:TRAP-type C4-dicarboxylate transport system permease large subunit
VGTALFVGCAVGGTKIEQLMRTIWPFYLAHLAAILLITFIPAFTLALPNWLS